MLRCAGRAGFLSEQETVQVPFLLVSTLEAQQHIASSICSSCWPASLVPVQFFFGWVATLVVAALTSAGGVLLAAKLGCKLQLLRVPQKEGRCCPDSCPLLCSPAAFTAQGVYAPFRTDTYQRVADTTELNTTASECTPACWQPATVCVGLHHPARLCPAD